MSKINILKGHILYTDNAAAFTVHENSYIVSVDGTIEGVYSTLPHKWENVPVDDQGNKLIIPGFYDLHSHAGQYLQCGTGMNKQLLEWLNDYTYRLEHDLADTDYAQAVYREYVRDLKRYGTLGSCTFATTSKDGTAQLFECFKASGLRAFVGKVNMVRNAPDFIIESLPDSIDANLSLIEAYQSEDKVKPILTPRFAPTSTEESLAALGNLAHRFQIPVQSHISENQDEIKWVKSLYPWAENYASVYAKFGLWGTTPTLMSHAVYLTPQEIEMSRNRNVYLVHCPDSNINVRSGIAPVKEYLNAGLNVGLGSDIAGGHKIQMTEAIVRAIQSSKLLSMESPEAQLSLAEAFFMATAAGGSFFGNVGKIKAGYELDVLVIDDHPLYKDRYSLTDRLEKFIYTGDDRWISDRFVQGERIEI